MTERSNDKAAAGCAALGVLVLLLGAVVAGVKASAENFDFTGAVIGANLGGITGACIAAAFGALSPRCGDKARQLGPVSFPHCWRKKLDLSDKLL